MSSTPFDVEVLKELREHTRLFLKLDLAYLVAGGTIVTALKISRGELIEFGAALGFVVFAFVAIGVFDTTIDSLVFKDWLSARTGDGKRQPTGRIRVLLDIQPSIHLLFIAALLMYSVGFATGAQGSITRIEGRVMLQEEVEFHLKETGTSPRSLEELQAANRRINGILAKLDGEPVIIEANGPKSYRIIFGGWDKTIGTQDDEVVTQEYLIREAFERLFGSKEGIEAKIQVFPKNVENK